MDIKAWGADKPNEKVHELHYQKELGENDVLIDLEYCSLLRADVFFILESLWAQNPAMQTRIEKSELKLSYRSNDLAPARPSSSPPLFLRARFNPAYAGYCSCPTQPSANNVIYMEINELP